MHFIEARTKITNCISDTNIKMCEKYEQLVVMWQYIKERCYFMETPGWNHN